MQDVYKVNPKFIPLFRLSENWIYWYSPSMFIKWDLSIRITDLKFISETIEVSFSGITTAFSLLDSIEGFLFRYKSTILLPLYAVSGLKDVSKQFWQKQEVFLAYNLFRVEKYLHVASSKHLQINSTACPWYEGERSFIIINWQKQKLDWTIFLFFFSPFVKVRCISISIM